MPTKPQPVLVKWQDDRAASKFLVVLPALGSIPSPTMRFCATCVTALPRRAPFAGLSQQCVRKPRRRAQGGLPGSRTAGGRGLLSPRRRRLHPPPSTREWQRTRLRRGFCWSFSPALGPRMACLLARYRARLRWALAPSISCR